MRLARRAQALALTLLVLCAAVSAQTLRPADDPRNTAPTVGTGGPVGGPTGLFTIYDGSTLRKGEFTFSIGYSNFDRDPGNVDITEVPLSVQIGLSDHLELFFNTDGYRGVKVNSPQNLSSFYLPNTAIFTQRRMANGAFASGGAAVLQSGGAVVLAPLNNAGIGSSALFRPVGNQPFVQFPFVGGTAGNFQNGVAGTNSRFTFTLGGPTGSNGTGSFDTASNFPGIGSVFGSILPGIVLTQRVQAATATTAAIVVPDTFTTAPAYLPDAPFIGRLYGESSFSTFSIGAKYRFTGPENPFGIGLIPFYRFYGDKPDDRSGFNQLQRGASPGSSLGDFGLVLFADGRLSRSVNVSGNLGFILNSNPKSEALGDAVLLDRPNEFIAGVGLDFPVNEHFQPIVELKSVQYVGGRTPNAFQNNPVEFLSGVRIFPRRWFGFSAAYRAHLNQQGSRIFNDRDASDFPRGFVRSSDPHGYLFQFFAGHRNERAPTVVPNNPPTTAVSASPSAIILPCREGFSSETCTPTSSTVQLAANATDPDGDTLLYTWSTTGGRITGDGANVSWDLSGVQPGTYTASVEVDDGCGCIAFSSTTVAVAECTDCLSEEERARRRATPCPTIAVECPTSLTQAGGTVTFNATVGASNAQLTYNWTVDRGTIASGQGTNSITVDTTGVAGAQDVTATVTVGGLAANCGATASCRTTLGASQTPQQFDTYGRIARNDEKARLDNFAVALQNDTSAQGYIITYGGRRGVAGEAQTRADFAKNYLVNSRGLDAGRLVTVDGGFREEATTELWLVPSGAPPPTASPNVDASEVQTTRPPRRRAPRRRGRRDDDE
ncbi:MAG: Ig-like domain-containing protein [Pyrinomonadaceae bacterium]